MRTVLPIVALAAGVLAVPYKRDVVTDVNLVVVTDVVTVTAANGSPAATTPAQTSAAPSETAAVKVANNHYGHHQHVSSAVVAVTTSSSTSVEVPAASPTLETTSTVDAPSVTVLPVTSTPAPATTEAPVSSPAAPTISQAPSSTADALSSSYSDIAVYHHNLHRANHSAPDIVWDNGLASTAQKIAESCVYAHNTAVDGGGYGQNIAAGVQSNNISSVITDLFYNGEEPWYTDYGVADPSMDFFEHWGHFSQIVWKSTTSVGCYTKYCSNGLANTGSDVPPYFTVCNYKGPGNFAGEYGNNVLAPLGHPTASWSDGVAQ